MSAGVCLGSTQYFLKPKTCFLKPKTQNLKTVDKWEELMSAGACLGSTQYFLFQGGFVNVVQFNHLPQAYIPYPLNFVIWGKSEACHNTYWDASLRSISSSKEVSWIWFNSTICHRLIFLTPWILSFEANQKPFTIRIWMPPKKESTGTNLRRLGLFLKK